MNELRVHLTGECAELGLVPASDVARLLLLVENATARAASVVLGKPKLTTGRYREVIARAARFRLRAIESGSVVPVLDLPRPAAEPSSLEVETTTLTEDAVELLLDVAEFKREPHPVVARALVELADALRVGDRYEAVVFDRPTNGGPPRLVRVDGIARKHLRLYADHGPQPVRPDSVSGVLVEADFEKRTARLRTPTEPAVQVEFTEDLDDDIHAALRQPATLRGDVTYDPRTHVARSVTLSKVERGEQLVMGLDPQDYWRERSFEELAAEQGAGRPVDPEELYDADASEDEKDAFMVALAVYSKLT